MLIQPLFNLFFQLFLTPGPRGTKKLFFLVFWARGGPNDSCKRPRRLRDIWAFLKKFPEGPRIEKKSISRGHIEKIKLSRPNEIFNREWFFHSGPLSGREKNRAWVHKQFHGFRFFYFGVFQAGWGDFVDVAFEFSDNFHFLTKNNQKITPFETKDNK